MGAPGLNEFVKQYFPQIRKQGLIIDVRYNGGGFVDELIFERLRRILAGMDSARNWESGTIPPNVFNGSMVCLTNHYAASDGDIFSYTFKYYKLGPLIGERTWGGVRGIRGQFPLLDGGYITRPEFARYDVNSKWIIEKLSQLHLACWPQHLPDRNLEPKALQSKLRRIVELPHAVRRLLEQFSAGEARRDTDGRPDRPQRIANAVHASDVGQLLPTCRPRQDEIRVFRHPKEPEIHLAEQRPALQEQCIAEALRESPEQPREIEILLDKLRLHPLARCRLPAQIGEQGPVG